jgi:hypothetical protein
VESSQVASGGAVVRAHRLRATRITSLPKKRFPTSLQFCVFRFALFQYGDIAAGVFPEREEILIRGLCFVGVALQHLRACETKMSEGADGLVHDDAGMGEDFLEFDGGLAALMRGQIRLGAHKYGILTFQP